MKRYFFLITALVAAMLAGSPGARATTPNENLLDAGIFSNTSNGNKLDIKIKPTASFTNGTYSQGIITVKYSTAYNVTLSVSASAFGYTIALDATDNGYQYYVLFKDMATTNVSWNAGTEYLVAQLLISGPGQPGTGTFELTNDAFAVAQGGEFYQEMFIGGMGGGSGQQGIFYAQMTTAPLPIELTDFTAVALPDQTARLDWKAALELGILYYGIEHSEDGLTYAPIGKVAATGTQSGPASYGYLHTRPTAGNNYYRLKITDKDGAFELSPVRLVRFDDPGAHFKLWPNPTSGPFTLYTDNLSAQPEDLSYRIHDAAGRLIEEGQVRDDQLDFDFTQHNSGAYQFSIESNGEAVKRIRFVLVEH